MSQQQGQTLILAALALLALVALCMAVLDAGLFYIARLAMEHATTNAALAALQRDTAGERAWNTAAAAAAARQVLAVELPNARGLQNPAQVARDAHIELTAEQITVQVRGAVCLPLRRTCPAVTVAHTAQLRSAYQQPPVPTPIPGRSLPIP